MTAALQPEGISVNRLIGFCIVGVSFYILLSCMTKIICLLLFTCVSICMFSLLMCSNISLNIEHVIYIMTTSCLFYILINDITRENLLHALQRNYLLIRNVVYLNLLIITIGFFIPSCYSYGYVGFAKGAHQFLSCLMFVFVLVLYILKDSSIGLRDILLIVPILVSVSMGAARTYLIPTVILILMYYRIKLQNTKIKYLIILAAVVVAILYIPNSFIIQRFSLAAAEGAYSGHSELTAMSSGRFEIWDLDMAAFAQNSFFAKLIGRGFDYLYSYNKEHYGVSIWAHNDFIHILVSAGIVGVLYYIALLWNLIAKSTQRGISKIWLITFTIPVAILNGMYTYQQYVFSVVFFVLLINEMEEQQGERI